MNYGITCTAQSIASPQSYILRDCELDDVWFNGGAAAGVYFQSSIGDCRIENVNFIWAGVSPGNPAIRVNCQIFGNTIVKKATASGDAGIVLRVNASTGATETVGLPRLKELHLAADGKFVVHLTNVKHISSLRLTATSAPSNGIKFVNGSAPANVTNENLGGHDVNN